MIGPEPFDLVGPLSEGARRRLGELLRTSPVPEGRRPLAMRIGSIDDLVFTKNARLNPADLALTDSLKAGYVEIADAVVTPFGFLIAGDRFVFDTQILPNGWRRGFEGGAADFVPKLYDHNFIHRLDPWRETCLVSLPADMPEIEGPAFLFSSRLSCFNFAHLFHDTAIQAPTYLDARAGLGEALTPVLVGGGFPRALWGRLFAACIDEDAPTPLFLRGRFLRARRLIVPLTHFAPAHEAIARGAGARLRARLAAAFVGYREPRPRRLYISRADSGRGTDREPAFSNEADFRAALERLRFETVVASELGDEDYLRTFVNAEIVVGLHGAGLLNLALSRSPRVVEITAPGYPDWRSLRLFMEKGLGAPYHRVACAAPVEGIARYDVGGVISAAEELLAGL